MAQAQDIVATIGTYEKDGEKKYVTRKVGALVETKHGPRIKLDASFNPAGCVKTEDGGVWLAIFDQKEGDKKPERPQRGTSQPAQPQTGGHDFGDEIPFSPRSKREHW